MATKRYLSLLLLLALIAVTSIGQSNTVYAAGEEGLARAIAAQQRHNAGLLGTPGVVGTAVGIGNGHAPVVKVFVDPSGSAAIPGSLDGVRVVKEAMDPVVAFQNPCGGPPWERPDHCSEDSGGIDPTARFDRPVPTGVSTGHFAITAGTIGARLTDDGTNFWALSNNHVFANENSAVIGDNILQPGPFDGGTEAGDAIGTLHSYVEIFFDGTPNVVDAAIASTSSAMLDNATPSDGYGTPASWTTGAALNMDVKKYGRTTGFTTGYIDLVNVNINVGYDTGTALFVGQIGIRGDSGDFSSPGDSGSLIVASDTNSPVGLLFAGNNAYTFANPIGDVLAAFGGLTIDDGSLVQGTPPVVTVTSPADGLAFDEGVLVDFTATANDSENGDISASITWLSDLDGDLGTGAAVSTSTLSIGIHEINASVVDSDGLSGSDSITVTIQSLTPPPPAEGITIASINPDSVPRQYTGPLTITGTGFVDGVTVTFEAGSGPTPQASNLSVSLDGTTITGTLVVKNGGPPRVRLWNVRATNPDSSTDVLVDGLTVTP